MNDARALFFARIRILKNSAAGIKNEPVLKTTFIAVLTVSFWVGSFFLFYRGLSFFHAIPAVGPVLVDETMYIFFAVLFIMLVLSSLVVCHATFFNAQEIEFLLSKPLDHRAVFFYRFVQSSIYSSWAFLFLGIPFLVAYAIIRDASCWFYLALPGWFILFVILPTATASLLVLPAARFLDYRRARHVFIGTAVVLALAAFWYYRSVIAPAAQEGGDITAFMESFLYHLRILKHPLYPGYWMASSIIEAASGRATASVRYFFVYAATTALALQLNHIAAGRLYYRGWLASRNRSSRPFPPPDAGAVNRILSIFSVLPRPTAALVTKDIKTFARDFSQWSQFLIYLAILGVYILNLGSVPGSVNNPYWKMIVTFLNFSATSLVLAGFTVRFLFPQISLEGTKVWMLGLAPVTFRDLVLQKFFINGVMILLVSELLMTATNVMLETSPGLFFVSCAMTALTAVGLTGLAVGLGALYPNFREENPSRIVSGFGGTLNFITALIYVAVIVLLFAVPYFSYHIHHAVTAGTFRAMLAAAWTGGLAATAAAGLFPLVLGYRKLQRAEF
ncbi:MAG: hypothetical protein AVO39_11270 [delta proteobacterium MLS_D]|nr:MAG: hypothetical protein AVO39_11270 [delta proteobacterium MLS_D]